MSPCHLYEQTDFTKINTAVYVFTYLYKFVFL